jgi:hypothetical protein
MFTAALIPITVQPEAAELATRYNLHSALDEILDQVKKSVPGLNAVEIEYAPPYDTGEPGILIHAHRETAEPPHHECWQRFSAWTTARFSPDVWRHITLILSSTNGHGR